PAMWTTPLIAATPRARAPAHISKYSSQIPHQNRPSFRPLRFRLGLVPTPWKITTVSSAPRSRTNGTSPCALYRGPLRGSSSRRDSQGRLLSVAGHGQDGPKSDPVSLDTVLAMSTMTTAPGMRDKRQKTTTPRRHVRRAVGEQRLAHYLWWPQRDS